MQNTDSNEIKYNPLINCNVTLENNNIISIPVSEIHIPVKTGITLAGKVFGNLPTTNPKNKIIALHGWLDNCELYSDIAPKIVANYFKKNETISLIAFDSAGHGLSDHRSEDYGEIYYLWDYIADFISALDLLGKNLYILFISNLKLIIMMLLLIIIRRDNKYNYFIKINKKKETAFIIQIN